MIYTEPKIHFHMHRFVFIKCTKNNNIVDQESLFATFHKRCFYGKSVAVKEPWKFNMNLDKTT